MALVQYYEQYLFDALFPTGVL